MAPTPTTRAGGAKRSSYTTFLVIICFSIGLLGGYMMLGGLHPVRFLLWHPGLLDLLHAALDLNTSRPSCRLQSRLITT